MSDGDKNVYVIVFRDENMMQEILQGVNVIMNILLLHILKNIKSSERQLVI